MAGADTCVCYGEIIPEGYGQVCYACLHKFGVKNDTSIEENLAEIIFKENKDKAGRKI